MTEMAKDPSEMTLEEIEAELAWASGEGNTAAHEHWTPPPQGPDLKYQQVLDDMTRLEKARAMYGQGMNSAYTSVMNLVPGMEREPIWGQDVTDEGMLERRNGPDAALLAQPGAPALSIAGEATAMVPGQMAATGALSRVPWLGKQLFGTMPRRMITEGAIQGGVMAPPGHKAEGVLYGGGAGALFPAAKWGWDKITRGVDPTDWARTAMGKGVDLRVSQMNPKSTLAGIQSNWLNDLPIIGKRLRAGELEAYEQWKQATIQDVTAPGTRIPRTESLSQMLDDAYKTYGPAYDQVKGFPTYPYILNTNGPNKPLVTAFKEVLSTPGTYEDSARESVRRYLNQQYSQIRNLRRAPRSEDLLGMRSDIRSEIRRLKYGRNPSTNAEDKVALLEMAEKKVTEAVESQLPPDVMTQLKAIDRQYAKYKVMEDAMWRASGKPLMPSHITAAVRAASTKGQFARGHGLAREYADQADELFTTPEPHKADQFVATALPAAAATLHPIGTAATLSPLLALTGTKLGRRVAGGATRPQEALRTLTDRVLGATQSELAQKYGVAPGYLARGTIRGGTMPEIEARSQTLPNRALGILQDDLDQARSLVPFRE